MESSFCYSLTNQPALYELNPRYERYTLTLVAVPRRRRARQN